MTSPRLVATSWTSAGDTSPMHVPGTSPVPIADALTAIADAGFCGFGLIADDLIAIRDSIGFDALRGLIADAGLSHVEIELLERWWIPRGEPGHTYDVRDLLFEAADVLAPAFRSRSARRTGPRHRIRWPSPRRCASWPSRPPPTAPGSPSRPCRSRPSPRCRWAPKSSLRQAIRRPDCSSTPGMCSGPAPPWPNYARL